VCFCASLQTREHLLYSPGFPGCAFHCNRTAEMSNLLFCYIQSRNRAVFPDSKVYESHYTRDVRKVKNVCAYNPRSCFIVPDQSFGVFSRV